MTSGTQQVGWKLACWLLLPLSLAAQQPPQPPPIHATHYQVEAILFPSQQILRAHARLQITADQPVTQLTLQLHPALRVTAARMGNSTLAPQRAAGHPDQLVIPLPQPLAPQEQATLDIEYNGTLAESSASSEAVPLARLGRDACWLLLPGGWFPLTGYPGQRYTATFQFVVPANFVVVGTGTSSTPERVPAPPGAGPQETAWLQYVFRVDRPSAAGSFLAAALQLTPVTAAGFSIAVYTPPAQVATAASYGETLGRILEFFSSTFGPLPERQLTLALLPADPGLESFSGPGLLVVAQPAWSPKPNERALATAAAEQWWNDAVLPASLSDLWLADGLARYSAVLYLEATHGENTLHREVTQCSIEALMDESAAPIAQAWRLPVYSLAYRSVVIGKGAMVFHMLRRSLGDEPFHALLRNYFQQFAGKTARTEDFEKLVQAAVANKPAGATGGPAAFNPVAFFAQWVHSTGVPEFHLEYVVYRTPRGFRVVGKISQNLTALNMPVTIRVDTEGNPVTQTVLVTGNTTEFSIDTFGLPKPNGIHIDPDNDVLKATTDLRIRALIAEGEALTRQGRYFEAVQQYRRALDLQRDNALALFRLGEAMFYEKNYQAAANAFHDALDGQFQPDYRWVEVWSHIYLGKIYDLIGQRERAVNEYQKAIETKDDTDGAQAEAQRYLQKPYSGGSDNPVAQ